MAIRIVTIVTTLLVTTACLGPDRPAKIAETAGIPSTEQVPTAYGPVMGIVKDGSRQFLGIPFGADTGGENRFRPPQPPTAWTAPLAADALGLSCPQDFDVGPTGEDCLNLNVYTPADARPGDDLPVMVWAYGGAYAYGSNVQYDGHRLARDQNVIVVMPNYRTNAFGFLAHPALDRDSTGNYGLLDLAAAHDWVRTNIVNFGGDPGNVTAFGQSAGSYAICTLMAGSATGRPVPFERAILQSGSCTADIAAIPLADAYAGGEKLSDDVGCGTAEDVAACLREVPAEALLSASPHRRGLGGNDAWTAAYGGAFLPEHPRALLRSPAAPETPILAGVTHQEGRLYVNLPRFRALLLIPTAVRRVYDTVFIEDPDAIKAAYGLSLSDFSAAVTDGRFACPLLDFAAATRGPTYFYEFHDSNTPISVPNWPFTPDPGSFHAGEIVYIFQTAWPLADPADFTPEGRVLATQMQDRWAAFARNGDPNTAEWSGWRAGSRGRPFPLVTEGTSLPANYADDHRCPFWTSLRAAAG